MLVRASHLFCTAVALLLLTSTSSRANPPYPCVDFLLHSPGQGQLLGIVVGGRSSGTWLAQAARDLGFATVHLYSNSIPAEIRDSFSASQYDLPDVTYQNEADLEEAARTLRAYAEQHHLSIAGFIPGMDYGTADSDWLSHRFHTRANPVATSNLREDKGLLNQWLGSKGVPVAPSLRLNPEEALAAADHPAFPFPWFLKPTLSWGSVGAGAVPSAAGLKGAITKMKEESERVHGTVGPLLIQPLLHPNKVYFIDAVQYETPVGIKRIVTGAWIDYRRDDFPKEVWDFIIMIPPPAHATEEERSLFSFMLAANQRALTAAEVTTGVSHFEFMSQQETIRSADDLFPTDLNLRQPGLRTAHLEQRATQINPYSLDILSRTHPDLLNEIPSVYSQWKEHVAHIFLRTAIDGEITAEGHRWLESLKKPQAQYGGAYLAQIFLSPAGTKKSKTIDGSTMVGNLHAAAPTRNSLELIYNAIREKERARFFVR